MAPRNGIGSPFLCRDSAESSRLAVSQRLILTTIRQACHDDQHIHNIPFRTSSVKRVARSTGQRGCSLRASAGRVGSRTHALDFMFPLAPLLRFAAREIVRQQLIGLVEDLLPLGMLPTWAVVIDVHGVGPLGRGDRPSCVHLSKRPPALPGPAGLAAGWGPGVQWRMHQRMIGMLTRPKGASVASPGQGEVPTWSVRYR